MNPPKGEYLRAGRIPVAGKVRMMRTSGGWVRFRDFEKPRRRTMSGDCIRALVQVIYREVAEAFFRRLFLRWARAVDQGAVYAVAWELRIMRLLEQVNGTGLCFEWNSRDGHFQIWVPQPDADPIGDFLSSEEY